MSWRATLLCATALLAAGCAGDAEPEPAVRVDLRPIDAAGLEELLEEHHGEVVLVDFWATWCEPCLELLPHTVDLQQRFCDRGLFVVTVSVDGHSSEALARKVLSKLRRGTENRISSYGGGSAAVTAFGITSGALPHLRLYDRRGKLHQTFASGGRPFDARDIERAVEALVKSSQ